MPNRRGAVAVLASAALLAACQSLPPAPATESHRPAFTQIGIATWYGPHFQRRRTADGERFDMHALTAAHRTLPFNSYVRVTDLATDRSVIVRINDRGPYRSHRIIDLSSRAARELGIRGDGIARVRIELVNVGETSALDGRAQE